MSQLSQETPPTLDVPPTSLCFWHQPIAWLYAFWKFSRPHTVIGTSLSVLALFLIALAETTTWETNPGVSSPFFPILLPIPALLACLCGNVYIVGLNQLEDVEIDRINKPHLPLASGEFSRTQGQAIVAVTGSLALLLSAWQGVFLMATVWLSLAIGTAYSLPPLRLKRFPVWASLCIFSVRGAIVNLGLFLHFQQQLGVGEWGVGSGDFAIPSTVWVLTLFILVFTFAIAIFKDIPDLEGDRQYHITTFTIQLGQQAVFNLARWVLTVCYGGMILGGALLTKLQTPFLIGTQLAALVALWLLSFRVDLSDQRSIARFYQFIWKLFFLEYLLFPIACLLAVNSSI
jgi:homogentisate phytyltransferase / homogentisate geranylgeranyltransferase